MKEEEDDIYWKAFVAASVAIIEIEKKETEKKQKRTNKNKQQEYYDYLVAMALSSQRMN